MANPSEPASWKWADTKQCGGCGKTLTIKEVRVWTRRLPFCVSCFDAGKWILGQANVSR